MSALGVLKVFRALEPLRTGVHKITATRIDGTYMFSYKEHHVLVDAAWVLQTGRESLKLKDTIPAPGVFNHNTRGGTYHYWASKIQAEADVIGPVEIAQELFRSGKIQKNFVIKVL